MRFCFQAMGQFETALGGESFIFSCLQLAPRIYFVEGRWIIFMHLSVPLLSLRCLLLPFSVPLGSFGAVALRALGTPVERAEADLLEMPVALLIIILPPRHIPLDAPLMLFMALVRPLPQNLRWPITASFLSIPPPACRYGISLPARAGIMCDSGRKSNAGGSSGPGTSPLPGRGLTVQLAPNRRRPGGG